MFFILQETSSSKSLQTPWSCHITLTSMLFLLLNYNLHQIGSVMKCIIWYFMVKWMSAVVRISHKHSQSVFILLGTQIRMYLTTALWSNTAWGAERRVQQTRERLCHIQTEIQTEDNWLCVWWSWSKVHWAAESTEEIKSWYLPQTSCKWLTQWVFIGICPGLPESIQLKIKETTSSIN